MRVVDEVRPPRAANFARFVVAHAPQLLVAPLMLLVCGTFLHEMAHALVALVQGATIHEFVFLPDGERLGYVSYDAPNDPWFSPELVAIAPYLMWSAVAAGVIVLAAFSPRGSITKGGVLWASTLFIWGYVMPMGDIALNLYAGSGDLAAPGWEGDLVVVIGTSLLGGAYLIGYWVQRRLYRDWAVGVVGYVIASVVLSGALGMLGLVGLLGLQLL